MAEPMEVSEELLELEKCHGKEIVLNCLKGGTPEFEKQMKQFSQDYERMKQGSAYVGSSLPENQDLSFEMAEPIEVSEELLELEKCHGKEIVSNYLKGGTMAEEKVVNPKMQSRARQEHRAYERMKQGSAYVGGSSPKLKTKNQHLSSEMAEPMEVSPCPVKGVGEGNRRLKVLLPGKDNQVYTWEELLELEKCHGKEIVLNWLKGGKLVFPSEEKVVNPEFEKHMKQLRARQEQRDYERMIQGSAYVGGSSLKSLSPEHTGNNATTFQLSAVALNMGIGVFCAYVAADFLCKQYGLDKIKRALWSLGAMIFVLIMEMVLFIIRADKFDKADKERKQKLDMKLAPSFGLTINKKND